MFEHFIFLEDADIISKHIYSHALHSKFLIVFFPTV